MNKLKELHIIWQKLTFWGVTDDLSIEETIKTRLLNIVLFIGVAILSLLWIRTIIVQQVGQMLIISTVFLLIIGILLFNVNRRQKTARLIIMFGISLVITAILIFIHPSPWELEYIFLMIIFVNLIFFQGKTQILIVLFVTSLFVAAHIIEPILPMDYKVLIPLTPNLPVFLFIFFVLYSSITFTFYQTEIKKYQNAQKETIEALQHSNLILKSVSEELERFIYIVSSDLKNRLQKVRKNIELVRKEVNQYQYGNIDTPLGIAQDTAHQMHFWVNDILEFSTISKSGKRLEDEISFDELFNTIKNNLSKEIDNFEHRITWTTIPSVRLNKLEVFIVFYNILKIAFYTTNATATIKTLASIKNGNLSIQFICVDNGSNHHQNKLLNKRKENLEDKIKLCQSIVKGWNGVMKIETIDNNKIYQVNIPKDKVLIQTLND